MKYPQKCCACGQTKRSRNIVMLEQKTLTLGKGWGCVQCGLKMDGAVAMRHPSRCCACGATSQAHHTVTKGAGGSDLRTLAVCWKHHAELHNRGAAWFEEEYMVDLKDEMIRSLESYIAGGRG